MKSPLHSVAGACLGLLFFSAPLLAQGLQDLAARGLTPPTSVATVDEASAVLVNPAGLGFVTGPELMVLHSSIYGPGRSDVDSVLAGLTFLDTLGLGLGVEIARPQPSAAGNIDQPFVRATLAYALRLDQTLSLGGSYRIISAQSAGLAAAQTWDMGVQLRLFRFMTTGLTVENAIPIEGPNGPLVPRAYRFGVGLRPNAEWATLAFEARVDEALRVDPALLLRWQPLNGITASLQLASRDIRQGFGDSTVSLGLEVQHNMLGLGASAASSTTPGLAGFTAYGRASLAAYPSVLPRLARAVHIELAGDMRPVVPDNPIDAASYSSEEIPGEIGLAIDRAARDDSVEALWIHLEPLSAGYASVEAMRQRLHAFRKTGKKVFVFAERFGNREYLLASAADVIVAPPSASFSVSGIGVTSMYFAATLKALGIEAHAIHAGKYKSAPETFTRSEPSEAAVESSRHLNDVIAAALHSAIAKDRQLDPAKVKQLIDRGSMSAQEAQDAGLIDRLAYADELPEVIEDEIGSRPIIEDDYLRPLSHHRLWGPRPTIAVIPVEETITMGRSSSGLLGMGGNTGARDVVAALESAAEDDDVRAIVLRINSPGGDALASDLIWRAVQKARTHKPVIASMGDVAASGGYYVACGADMIFAEPTTITGSIGVFAMFFSAQDLLQRLHVGVYEDRRAEGANLLASHRAPSEAERAILERAIGETYTLFKKRVAKGRKLSMPQVEAIAQGRVWTGLDAVQNKLVDASGGLFEALSEARRRAELDSDEDVEIKIFRSGSVTAEPWSTAVVGARALFQDRQAPLALPAQIKVLATGIGPWLSLPSRQPLAVLPQVIVPR